MCSTLFLFNSGIHAQSHYQNSLNYFNQGNTTEALQEVNLYIAQFPDQADGWNLRAFYYMQTGQKELAIDNYSKALEITPNDIGILTNRSLLYMELERYTLALKDLDKKVELMPQEASNYFDRAYCLALMENYDQALNDFDTSIHLDPNNASTYANRGFTKINQLSNEGLIRPAPEECTEACIDLEKALSMGDSSVVKMMKLYCR